MEYTDIVDRNRTDYLILRCGITSVSNEIQKTGILFRYSQRRTERKLRSLY